MSFTQLPVSPQLPPSFCATNKLSWEGNVEKMRNQVRRAIKGPKKWCYEKTGKTVEVCFSKNVTVWAIAEDVSSLREKVVDKVQYVKMTTANICSLNHGAAGSADFPICPLCHWSKLAFMRLPSMQFIAVLNKASSVYNPMLFPQASNCRLTLPSWEQLRKRTLLAENHGPKCGSNIKHIQMDLYWHVCWKTTS